MTTYEQERQNILSFFQTAILFAQKIHQEQYIQRLQETAHRLEEEQFIVVVCGEFRRGKSSLLNALLNEMQDLFPVDITVTTNLVTTASYGPSEKITALVDLSGSEEVQEISIKRNEIRHYVTEKDNPRNMHEARLMTIQLPNEQLKRGLVLVDTPGVGGLYTRHTDITYEFIPNADAIVYVSDALQPLSEEDLKFIKDRILKHTQYIFFVLTKKDRVRNYQEVVKINREKLAVTLGRPEDAITIVPVSSYAKRTYLKTHDPADLEDSNFPQLESVLWQFINENRGQVLLAKALTTLAQVVGEMRRPLQVEYDTCLEQDKQKLDELATSLEQAQEYLQRLQENWALWQTQLRDGLENIRNVAQHQLDRGFADIRRNVDGYLAEEKVVEEPQLVLEPLQRDINDLLYAVNRTIRADAADLPSRLEYSTGLVLNPFEPDSLRQQTRALSLQGMPPIPMQSSSRGNMASSDQRGYTTGDLIRIVYGSLGRYIGVVFGQPSLGDIIGGGVGHLAGAKSGSKQALQQMREQNRQHISGYLLSLLADSQREHSQLFTRAIDNLGQAMRDDLLDKIKVEKQSREQALGDLQKARKLTEAETDVRITELKDSLEQLDQIQWNIAMLARSEQGNDNQFVDVLNESNDKVASRDELPLFAITRAQLEEDNKAFVGKSYTFLAGISLSKPAN